MILLHSKETLAGSIQRPPHHVRGVALMLFSAACFTANVLLIRGVAEFEVVNVWLVSLMRFAVGIAVLAAIYPRQVRFKRVFVRPKLIGRGVAGGVGIYVYYLTVVHLGAGRATFINNTYIIFGALFAVWVLGERFHRALAIGSIAALGGLALLTNVFASASQTNAYDALAIGGAFASAYVVITIRQLHAEGEHTATIFAAQCTYGVLLCVWPAMRELGAVSPGAWTLLAVAGVCAAAGQLAMTRAFLELPVAEGSLIQILVPLGITAGGVVFFHEHFAAHELIGAALILVGMIVTVLRRREADC